MTEATKQEVLDWLTEGESEPARLEFGNLVVEESLGRPVAWGPDRSDTELAAFLRRDGSASGADELPT